MPDGCAGARLARGPRFRAFGTEPRRLDLDAPLIVVHGRNSQGKSSLAEALEFLLTGRSSRRDLLGGAKAEYHESLRNVHMPVGDQAVWVAAGMRGSDGQVHEVPPELVCDFSQGTECESRLLVDGMPQTDLAAFALARAAGSALGAPVLLQHTLRHVLSTQPKERVAYFKSLLSTVDADGMPHVVPGGCPSTPPPKRWSSGGATFPAPSGRCTSERRATRRSSSTGSLPGRGGHPGRSSSVVGHGLMTTSG